ncbi:unnamed protein product [Clonostachys rosea f. rosea IK726]|uniref:Uncharacterized protein n=1 Tax=Clonostachys rosea f. rosea IK726 TaxID=1349383 RepID=A0ACA9TE07_BIOOC|nr:unnamed protein product [Clonostachys rosea f. rosea IK726]
MRLLRTRCDPYIKAVLSDGAQHDFHYHSNLVRAVMPWKLRETDDPRCHQRLPVDRAGRGREGFGSDSEKEMIKYCRPVQVQVYELGGQGTLEEGRLDPCRTRQVPWHARHPSYRERGPG